MPTLTNEQKRVAIAECCGWKLNPAKHAAKILDWIHEPTGHTGYFPPDFLNSLDAIAQAEATLSEGERRTYFYHLFGTQRLDDGDLWKAVHATATQRADAFLKVKGIL